MVAHSKQPKSFSSADPCSLIFSANSLRRVAEKAMVVNSKQHKPLFSARPLEVLCLRGVRPNSEEGTSLLARTSEGFAENHDPLAGCREQAWRHSPMCNEGSSPVTTNTMSTQVEVVEDVEECNIQQEATVSALKRRHNDAISEITEQLDQLNKMKSR